MRFLLQTAGLGQLLLAFGSLLIPRILHWPEDLAKLKTLTRQVFWTYALYIWSTNIFFGAMSLFAADWLLDSSPATRALTGYIAAYWGVRLGAQLFYLDRSAAPPGLIFKVAEVALVLLFTFLTLVYGYATLFR